MKILVLSFYYEPDLSAGSFRTTALVKRMLEHPGVTIDVVTTMPNRYSSYKAEGESPEEKPNLTVTRIALPSHKSGMLDQAKSFLVFVYNVSKQVRNKEYDMVYATSSRLLTGFLGALVCRSKKVPLYLDIRDIFVDTINDILPKKVTFFLVPILKLVERYTVKNANKVNIVSKGFEEYFVSRYGRLKLSFFTNGVDDVFIEAGKNMSSGQKNISDGATKILYAGNMGEGQGLHKIVPLLLERLGKQYSIELIGDGGRKGALLQGLKMHNVTNVNVREPVKRDQLISEYKQADVLFLHLNDIEAFKKVLPSKIFEYAALGKPILAGVSGYAAKFLREEVTNCAVFPPGDVESALAALSSLDLKNADRSEFVNKYARSTIVAEMSKDVLSVAPPKKGIA